MRNPKREWWSGDDVCWVDRDEVGICEHARGEGSGWLAAGAIASYEAFLAGELHDVIRSTFGDDVLREMRDEVLRRSAARAGADG